jgi:hypothetical protein
MIPKKSLLKDETRSKILREHSMSPKSRSLILLDIQDESIREFLLQAGKSLDIALVISTGSPEEK